jgi:hypothetical protein
MNRELRKRLLMRAGIFFGIIVAVAAASFFIVSRINKVNQATQEVRQKLVDFNAMSETLVRLEKESRDAILVKTTLDKQLLGRDDLLAKQPELNILARQSGLLQNFSFRSETPPSPESLGQISAAFQLVGSFGDFIKYMGILRKNIFIAFESFSFSADQDLNNSDARIDFTASIPTK